MAQAAVTSHARTTSVWPWAAIFGRILLFVLMQALFALGLGWAGAAADGSAAAAWWPLGVTLTNIVILLVLSGLYRAEGGSYWDMFRIRREHLKRDLVAFLGVMVIAGPIGFLPNVLLAGWLFTDPQEALALLVRPLPLWAVYAALILFPVTQGLVEIPTYFVFAMPRLEAQGVRPWLALTLPAVMLGLQHLAAPLVFDLRFMTWRALMFLPFALLVGLVLRWRPRLLPFLAAVHVLMDLSFAAMFLSVAY